MNMIHCRWHIWPGYQRNNREAATVISAIRRQHRGTRLHAASTTPRTRKYTDIQLKLTMQIQIGFLVSWFLCAESIVLNTMVVYYSRLGKQLPIMWWLYANLRLIGNWNLLKLWSVLRSLLLLVTRGEWVRVRSFSVVPKILDRFFVVL